MVPPSRSRAHRPKLMSLAAIIMLALLGLQAPVSAQSEDLGARALQLVADREGIAIDDLAIAEASESNLSNTGVDLADFKVQASDGRTFGVSFDATTQEVVDAEAAVAAEQQARTEALGAVDPGLADQLQQAAAERIPVAIWTVMDDPGAIGRTGNGLDELAAEVEAAEAPVVDAVEEIAGTEAAAAQIARAELVPVVFAELTAGQIAGLSHHPNVAAIYDFPESGLTADDMATSDRYPFIWSSATGTGTQVAVHEDDGVDNVNTFLNNTTHGVSYWSDTVSGLVRNIGSHATNVAGVIASTHNWRRGGAFGIGQILSANFQTFSGSTFGPNAVNSGNWAVSNGADTINMSWGTFCSNGAQNFFSRWVDFLVKATGVNVVASSGNSTCPSGTPQYVGAPSLGWNTISAGSYHDNNTGLRTDDVLSSFTSFVNPTDPNSGRTVEKPDVTGMGGQLTAGSCFGVETTAVGGGVTDSTCGTSFAAPDASALTQLVMQKTGLTSAAELTKAIVMAGATHNIVDGANYRDCPSSPTANDCRDGAGGIDAYQTIKNVATPGNWRFPGLITPASFDASGNINYTTTFSKGKDARVVIAWDSTASCTNLGTTSQACASDVLNADLDLQVLDPNGVVVAGAASFQNSAEVVDFKPAVTGTYTIRVHNFRFDSGTNTFLGVAWNKATKDLLTPVKSITNFALNTTKSNQTTDLGRSFWDTYTGTPSGCSSFLSPEDGLEKVYKVSTNSTGQITATLSNIVGFAGVNSDIDVIILRKSGAANAQNAQVRACGDTQAIASGQPSGTYYVVVDGFAGSVARFNLAVNFAAGSVATPAEPLPVR